MDFSNVDDTIDDVDELFKNSESFTAILDDMIDVEISEHNLPVLIYIAGYVANSVGRKLKCPSCICRLSKNSDLHCDFSPEIFDYLKSIDRGGLKWPSDFTLDVCSKAHLLFQEVVSKLEKEFLLCTNQRSVLVYCCVKFCSKSYDTENVCSSCSRSLIDVTKMMLRPMINILLNNFTKVKNDQLLENKTNKRRKLSTLQ
jgi:hypothetical protein